jgi:hypothetical protein
MKIKIYKDKESWFKDRRGKITGSRAGDIISKAGIMKSAIVEELERLEIPFKKSEVKEELQKLLPRASYDKLMNELPKKKAFYELIAEKVATEPEGENPMDRGQRLEPEAIARFIKETGKKIDTSLVMWQSEENENIAVSPDGFVPAKNGKIKEAVEAKCLSSASHIEAWLTKTIPEDYESQKLQYFVVNPNLEILHFVFYDPRIPAKDYFVLTFNRKELQSEIDYYLDYEKRTLEAVAQAVTELTF